jgi:hypothetical protein
MMTGGVLYLSVRPLKWGDTEQTSCAWTKPHVSAVESPAASARATGQVLIQLPEELSADKHRRIRRS